jgi:branched-chain amino acid transport system ATP-binding protein
MSLIFDAVSAGYGDSLVLRDVDLVVPSGRVVALLGPNGAGKTTLLRVAAGQVSCRKGRLLLMGDDVTDWPSDRRARRGLCLVPEGRGIFPTLTVGEHLRLYSGRDASARAVDAFPKLRDRLDQTVGTMSGGEQQMVALARAYVTDAPFVLLDEVSMGLAPNLVDEVFEFIRQLATSGRSLLLVEQYITKALAVADYVYLLNRGRVSFAGEPAEVDNDALFSEYVGGIK